MSNDTPDVPQKQCPWCDKLLPVTGEFWATDKSSPDELCPVCKACQYKRRRELKAINAEKKALAAAGLKKCTGCEIAFPATEEYFYKAKKTPTGLTAKCKQCHAENVRATRNKERERDTAYKYFLAHKKEAYERHERWRTRNIEREREKERRHQQAKRDRKKLSQMWLGGPKRKRKDPFRKKKKKASRAKTHRYKARKAGLPSNFTEQDWQFALAYFSGCCAVCGRPILGLFHTAHADHWQPMINPHSPGTVPGNIVPLCGGFDGCNSSKGQTDPERWLIKKFGDKQAKSILAKIHEFFSKVRQV